MVSKNRACLYTARHLSRPKMSLSCPFTTINIFDTLRPGVVMPFLSLMDGIDGGGRGGGGLESQSFDSSDWLEMCLVLGEVAFRSMFVDPDFLERSLKNRKVVVAQLCPTLYELMDCSPPGSSVSGIVQAGILEWVAIPFSRGSSQPRDRTRVSCTTGRFFSSEPSFNKHHLLDTSECLAWLIILMLFGVETGASITMMICSRPCS